MCTFGIPETIAQKFCNCKIAGGTWDFAIDTINSTKAHSNEKGLWRVFHMYHEIFGKIPVSLSMYSRI